MISVGQTNVKSKLTNMKKNLSLKTKLAKRIEEENEPFALVFFVRDVFDLFVYDRRTLQYYRRSKENVNTQHTLNFGTSLRGPSGRAPLQAIRAEKRAC